MKLRVESSDEDIIIVKKDELIDIESEIILNSILKQIYPDKYIKRIIYKPYLDYFFPYLDLSLDGRSNQLTLFYGDQNVHLSDKKYCISCNKELSTGNLSKIQVPVSLCQRCLELLFHGYWDCLNRIENKALALLTSDNRPALHDKIVCENLFLPRCGFTNLNNKTIPCLISHGIGIVIYKDNHISLIFGTEDRIKYRMISGGGICGIILRVRNKILNIDELERFILDFCKLLKKIVIDFNSKISRDLIEGFCIHGGLEDKNFTYDKHLINGGPISKVTFLDWIFLTFFQYYKNRNFNMFAENYFLRIQEFLEHLINGFKEFEKYNLQIVDFISLYECYPPIDFNLRRFLEENFSEYFDKSHQLRINKDFFEEDKKAIILRLKNCFNWGFSEECKEEILGHEYFSIQGISGVFGPYLLVKMNNNENYNVILSTELIGRSII